MVCRYSTLTVSSSNGNTATLTDAATISSIANAMRDGTVYESGFTWRAREKERAREGRR
jgi:hypothetical protein